MVLICTHCGGEHENKSKLTKFCKKPECQEARRQVKIVWQKQYNYKHRERIKLQKQAYSVKKAKSLKKPKSVGNKRPCQYVDPYNNRTCGKLTFNYYFCKEHHSVMSDRYAI